MSGGEKDQLDQLIAEALNATPDVSPLMWRPTTREDLVKAIEALRDPVRRAPLPPKRPGKGVRGLTADYVIYDELADMGMDG